MPYSPAESFRLLTTYLGPTPAAFDPGQLPEIYTPIILGLLTTYIKDPQNVSARHTAFKDILETLTPREIDTFEAYLEEGSIAHHATKIPLTIHQKAVLRTLFNIAPEQSAEIARYIGEDHGNTHRRLQALVKKQLVIRTIHNNKILYHLCPRHFFVENPFPDPFAHMDFNQLLAHLTSDVEQLEARLENQP